MHHPIDVPIDPSFDHRIYLQVDDALRGPVKQLDETCGPGLFILDFGPVMPDEPGHIIGEARLIDRLTDQMRNIECLNVSWRNGCYQVLCADLGLDQEDPEAQTGALRKTKRLDDFLLHEGRMIGGVKDVLVSSSQPEEEGAFVRFTVDSDAWRVLGLQRDSCAHCDAQANGPCQAVRLGRRAMRTVTYPDLLIRTPEEYRIELLELAARRRCLLEPVAVTSDRFEEVRVLARVRGVRDLAGKMK